MDTLTIPATSSGIDADLDLAERHRYGDPQAFEEVYRTYSGMVYNLAYRMADNAEQTDDLTQDIFLRVHRHLGKFNGRSTLKTWIYRVAINQCRSRLNRRRWFFVPLGRDEDNAGVELVDERRDPEDRAVAEDLGRRLRNALAKVKPVFREAVILRDLEELTYEEIAEVLGVRLGTVRSRIARGRDQLRLLLENSP